MSNDKRRSLITYNHITYFLYVISYFTAGLLWIVPIAMNYAKRMMLMDHGWPRISIGKSRPFGTVLFGSSLALF
ncbi:hypothetical protein [Psychrobacter sp. JCM 18900]|uniref:hypothetical protein n=1 Tax=Psychrobacter sp. JCM 18900 TaxID=1298608 RepID=UPI0021C3443E|nr:hypothetical protein [Psychrobacter sp. JCM 18900]